MLLPYISRFTLCPVFLYCLMHYPMILYTYTVKTDHTGNIGFFPFKTGNKFENCKTQTGNIQHLEYSRSSTISRSLIKFVIFDHVNSFIQKVRVSLSLIPSINSANGFDLTWIIRFYTHLWSPCQLDCMLPLRQNEKLFFFSLKIFLII